MSDLVALVNYIKALEGRIAHLERQDSPVAGAGGGGIGFNDAEGNPAPVQVVASPDGSSTYAARRDHVHALANNSVLDSNLVDANAATVKGRPLGAGAGSPSDLSAAQLITILNTADGAGSGFDADKLDGIEGSGYVQTSRTLTAGAGLTGAGDLSADRTLDVGAGDGITVNVNDVALTTPGTLTYATTNSSTGNHTHDITSVADASGGVTALLHAVAGGLILDGVTAGTFVSTTEVNALGDGGLRLEDNGNNLGIFIEDATADVGVHTTTPTSALEVAGILTLGDSGDNNIVKIRPAASVAIAADAYITIPTTVGLVLVNNASSGYSALFMLRGTGGVVYEVADPGGVFSVAAATDNSVNLYWDTGSSTYRLNNTFATSRLCSIVILGHTLLG